RDVGSNAAGKHVERATAEHHEAFGVLAGGDRNHLTRADDYRGQYDVGPAGAVAREAELIVADVGAEGELVARPACADCQYGTRPARRGAARVGDGCEIDEVIAAIPADHEAARNGVASDFERAAGEFDSAGNRGIRQELQRTATDGRPRIGTAAADCFDAAIADGRDAGRASGLDQLGATVDRGAAGQAQDILEATGDLGAAV